MIRRLVFWIHLAIGVAAAIAIFVMSVTGVLLAFERQMLHVVDRDLRAVDAAPGVPARSLGDMLATVATTSGVRPTGIVVRPEPTASIEFALGRDRSVYVDPYTGAVLGESSTRARAFFGVVERWHRTLGEPLGARGPLRAFAAASNLVFFVLALTGAYLWLPRAWTWTAVRAASLFRGGLRGRARDWNWHNVAGVWCVLPLLLVTLTGVVISYPWANALLFRMAGTPPPVRQGPPPGPGPGGRNAPASVSPEAAAAVGRAAAVAGAHASGWRTMTLRVPPGTDSQVSVTLDRGTGGQVEKRTELVVDGQAGRIVRTRGFGDQPLGQRLRGLARFIHTGEEGGLAGQAVAAIASAAGALLAWTGVSLALRRFARWRRGTRGPAERDAAATGATVALLLVASSFAAPGAAWAQAPHPGGADAGPQSPATAPRPAGPVFKAPTFADDTVTYVFGPAYRIPFITSSSQLDGADIARNAIEIKHVDAWKYGHNMIEVQIKKSNAVEPAAGGGVGALGLYSIFRSGLGINRLAGRPLVAAGPLKDIDIEVGMNLETKNSDYAPEERSLFVGPNLQFRFGQGFLNVGVHLRKEWNHNGNLGRAERYDADLNLSEVWHFPFSIGHARLAFDGFADYNTAKGKDAAGHDTKPEFITRPQLKLDLGPLVAGKAHVVELGVGFEYWHNMFGKDAARVPGAKQFTPVVTLAAHLPIGAR
jgi:uncharacterized iron-regulated membrane protein